jgi:hydroxylysine kinase
VAAPISRDVMTAASPEISNEAAARAAHELFGVRGEVKALDSERDQNFRVSASDYDHYVLKIANRAEDPSVLDLQRAALDHIAACAPELRVPRVVRSPDGNWCGQVSDEDGVVHRAWMLSYLPGRPLASAPRTPRLLRALGGEVARLGRALRGFFHPAAGRVLLWDVKHTGSLRDHLHHVEPAGRRRLASQALDEFDAHLHPELPGLRSQIIHNDANESNVLVDPADPQQLVGFIDFGDIVHTALVNDLAVAIASSVTDGERPVLDAAEIVAGYHSVTPLAEEEVRLLFELWKARLLAGVLISAWRSKLHPDNVAYISADDVWAWPLLERLANTRAADVTQEFEQACQGATAAAVPRAGR